MNLFVKINNGYRGEFKTLSNTWDRAFSQVGTGYRDGFSILLNIYDVAFVFLLWLIMINYGDKYD